MITKMQTLIWYIQFLIVILILNWIMSDVNDQVCLLVNTLNEALAQAQHCTSKVKWCCKVKVKAKRKIMETIH